MKQKILFAFLILSTALAFSQNNSEKIYFDKSGKPTNEEQAYYYRQRISGESYKCHYVNGGNIFFEGKIIHPSDSSENKKVIRAPARGITKTARKNPYALSTMPELSMAHPIIIMKAEKSGKKLSMQMDKL